jgi:mannose-1-phosphate guanylyltransferase
MTSPDPSCARSSRGGRGERFWCGARPSAPQLLPLAHGGRRRLAAIASPGHARRARPHVVVMTALPVEACRRVRCDRRGCNTAPAIAAAAAFFDAPPCLQVAELSRHRRRRRSPPTSSARSSWRSAVLAGDAWHPVAAADLFGYLKRGERIAERLYRVAQFTEKPDLARATAWVASGEYTWNSGMFVWGKRTFLNALAAGRPAIADQLGALRFRAGEERAFEAAIAERFPAVESVSVDYAVLEVAPNVVTLEASFDWDDVGNWNAWARRQPRDARGNVTWGNAIAVDCDDCVIVGDGVPTAPLGLSGMVVVSTPNGTLVCSRKDWEVRRVTEVVRAGGPGMITRRARQARLAWSRMARHGCAGGVCHGLRSRGEGAHERDPASRVRIAHRCVGNAGEQARGLGGAFGLAAVAGCRAPADHHPRAALAIATSTARLGPSPARFRHPRPHTTRFVCSFRPAKPERSRCPHRRRSPPPGGDVRTAGVHVACRSCGTGSRVGSTRHDRAGAGVTRSSAGRGRRPLPARLRPRPTRTRAGVCRSPLPPRAPKRSRGSRPRSHCWSSRW